MRFQTVTAAADRLRRERAALAATAWPVRLLLGPPMLTLRMRAPAGRGLSHGLNFPATDRTRVGTPRRDRAVRLLPSVEPPRCSDRQVDPEATNLGENLVERLRSERPNGLEIAHRVARKVAKRGDPAARQA